MVLELSFNSKVNALIDVQLTKWDVKWREMRQIYFF